MSCVDNEVAIMDSLHHPEVVLQQQQQQPDDQFLLRGADLFRRACSGSQLFMTSIVLLIERRL
jgi:hypothetical protein